MASTKIDLLPDAARSRLRVVSRQLHGSAYRLEIFYRVAQSSGYVFAHALAREAGVTDKVVGLELRRLEAAGLLEEVAADDPGQKRRYFRRLDSCFWGQLEEIVEEVVAGVTERGARENLRSA